MEISHAVQKFLSLDRLDLNYSMCLNNTKPCVKHKGKLSFSFVAVFVEVSENIVPKGPVIK